jgi:hypothetical protein
LQKKKLAKDNFDPFGESGQVFWGADEVLRWLKRYVKIERLGAEPNTYLVEPSQADLDGFGSKADGASKKVATTVGRAAAGSSSGNRDAEMDPFVKFVKETGWNIMNQFSKVTTFTRRAARDFAENNNLPPQVKRLLKNREVQTLQDEFDSARIYLARWAMGIAEQSERDRRGRIWTVKDVVDLEDTDVGEFELLEGASSLSLEERRRPLAMAEWDTFFDPETGRLSVTVDEVKERIFHGGLDAEDGVRKEAWLFLLGVYEWYGTADERKAQIASLRDQYYRLKHSWWERLEGEGGEGETGEWWREQKGRIGTCHHTPSSSSTWTSLTLLFLVEKDVHRTDRHVPIFQGEDTPHPDPNSPFADVGTNVHLEQMKEMLLTYNEYNTDLGYVQGMSDLLSPIYAVIQDDAIAFWGFQKFMERMERNFLRDQSGMRSQLLTLDHLVNFMDPKLWNHLQAADSTNFFFFFRMILVWYKREFAWVDILRLWEGLWTDYLSADFHLFVALAILEKHRDVIMGHLKAFDEVLKYGKHRHRNWRHWADFTDTLLAAVNELSNTMDLESTLIKAEALYRKFQRLVEAVDKKQNFPGPRQQQQEQQDYPSPSQASPKGKETQTQQMVISPELRQLLSRKVQVLPRKTVAEAGDGMPGK